MRDDAGREDQTHLLRRVVNGSKQTASGELGAPCAGIHRDLAHPLEVNYKTAITGAEAGEAMTATPDGGENSIRRSDPDGSLYILDVGATRDESGRPGDHTVPDGTRI